MSAPVPLGVATGFPVPPLARGLGLVLAALCLVVIAGLWWGRLEVVAVAPGRVVVAGYNKPVQAPELATVRAVLVQEGETVTRHQPLIALDSSTAHADLMRLERERESLRNAARRFDLLLSRLAHGKDETSAASLPADLPSPARAALDAEWTRYLADQATLDAEAGALLARLASVRAQGRQRARVLALLATEADALARLQARGAVPRLQWSQLERERLRAADALHEAQGALATAQAERQGLEARRAAVRAGFTARWREAQAEVLSQGRLLAAELAKARRRVAHCLLRAPVAGRVHALKVPAAGTVVQPAQGLLEIIPAAAPLVVEARIGNDDAARVQPGQAVVVKLDSFNYTRFGFLHGTVRRVSADAMAAPGEPLRFVAEVGLAPAPPAGRRVPGPLRPGMTATVEFLLGHRRAMDYLLGPLRRVADEAWREP